MPENLLDRAWEFHDRGDYPSACAVYEQLVAAEPTNAEAWFRFGAALLSLGDNALAAQHLEHAVRLGHAEAKNALAVALSNIGMVSFNKSDLIPALSFFERALFYSPEFPPALVNRGLCLVRLSAARDTKIRDESRLNEGVRCIERGVELQPDSADYWTHLASARRYQDRHDEALVCFDRALAINPNHARARFFRELVATQGPVAMPPELVKSLFNVHANQFDHLLVDVLKYETPNHLAQKFVDCFPAAADMEMIDLGCGTGLSGVAFKHVAKRMVGVDLAENMLDRAREKAVYAELHCMDILTALQTLGRFNLAVAADVFVYVDKLEPVFEACAKALLPGGWFVFSTEHTDEGDYKLTYTSRFAHNPAHVAVLAERYGFALKAMLQETIRMDAGLPVIGDLYVLHLAE